jgi:hypothetical protein
MKIFLIKTMFFLVLLAIGAFVLDFMIEKGLRKTGFSEFQTWNEIFSSKINSDVIISGSSRACFHINPEIFDSVLQANAYNLGINGSSFNMQYIRYKIFERYNKKPKLIIQGADFVTLYRKKKIGRSYFLPYVHECLSKQELNETGFTNFDLYVPALQYHSEFLYIFLGLIEFFDIKHFPNDKHKGYQAEDAIWDGGMLEIELSKDSLTAKVEPEMVELFDSFLNYCKETEIQVILVFTPQYINATNFTKNKDEVINIYHTFSKKYNIPFLDYSIDSLCYDTAYFYNAMHLNKKGSEIFSLKLANDIKKQNLYK